MVTSKYHLRINEDRKFHELNQVNFSKSIPATKIDSKLKGLKWITPPFKDNVEEEINFIKDLKSQIQTDKEKNGYYSLFLYILYIR